MSDRPNPTVADVARAAGVSTATVSRCLNDPDKLAKATRDRVLEAVRTLGYSPNFGAQIMANKRTRTIGAVVPTMDNAIFARGLQVFQDRLQQDGYVLLLASSGYCLAAEEDQIRALVARGAEGVLLIGQDRAPHVMEFLEAQSVPAVVGWTYAPHAPLPCVGFDNAAAMGLLANQVLAQGHRKIAMIAGRTADNDRARARVQGLRHALQAAGLPSSVPVIEAPYDITAGQSAFAGLMRDHAPTAVMCGNDVLAVGALLQAREMGLDVPGDVSITGFDDLEIAGLVPPGLTTLRVPHRQMGLRAAEMLLEMVAGQTPGARQALEVRVVTRGSLGPMAENAKK